MLERERERERDQGGGKEWREKEQEEREKKGDRETVQKARLMLGGWKRVKGKG